VFERNSKTWRSDGEASRNDQRGEFGSGEMDVHLGRVLERI
jgi:hypothetical protein